MVLDERKASIMGNDFFGHHPGLGSMFDFNNNDSLDFGEAAFMGAMGAALIDEAGRSERESKRRGSYWDDDWDGDESEDD